MKPCGEYEFLWVGLILTIARYHKLLIWVLFATYVAKGFTNIS
jgi:hypothetical protein